MKNLIATKTLTLWIPVIFALIPLIIGHAAPGLIFSLSGKADWTVGSGNATPIPTWVFIAVWTIAYPGMGLAAWHIWKRRTKYDATVPLILLTASFLITLSFWLSNSLYMIAVLDAINLILAWTTVWVYSRYSRLAVLFLLPWALWMIVTLAFKIIAVRNGLS